MGFVTAGMLMIGLGLLGFFGAKKVAPRALWIQALGSLAIVFLVFGGINQVSFDMGKTCTHRRAESLAKNHQLI